MNPCITNHYLMDLHHAVVMQIKRSNEVSELTACTKRNQECHLNFPTFSTTLPFTAVTGNSVYCQPIEKDEIFRKGSKA